MNSIESKQAAVDYLQLVLEGRIDEAYEKHIDMSGKHHNAFTPAGMEALREGMKGADAQFPNMQFEIKHVLGDDDLVAIHSHLTLDPGKIEFSAVHIFRLQDGKIVEIWDTAQNIVGATANTDGAF